MQKFLSWALSAFFVMVILIESPIQPVNPISGSYTTFGSLIDPSVIMAGLLCVSAGVIIGMAITINWLTDRSWFLFPTLGATTGIILYVFAAVLNSATISVALVAIAIFLLVALLSFIITVLIGDVITECNFEQQQGKK